LLSRHAGPGAHPQRSLNGEDVGHVHTLWAV
jgi:hypothetical protein